MAKKKIKKTKVSKSTKSKKYIYFFGGGKADGDGDMKDLLGGKGAGLAGMTRAGVPVPPGFTITTEVCNMFYEQGAKTPDFIDKLMLEYVKKLEDVTGKKFNGENPLLVSVRSGAKFSMPGMMDTILNLGMNDKVVLTVIKLTNNPRFAWDSYRRFIQMFYDVALELPKKKFEEIIEDMKEKKGVKLDTELDAKDMEKLVAKFKELFKKEMGYDFPQDPIQQLRLARDAVFKSWNNDRAITYRKLNDIPHN